MTYRNKKLKCRMMKTQIIPLLATLLFVIIQVSMVKSAFAQQTGAPFITNYPPEVYKANPRSWAIVQDNRGVMFFGNGHEVLEYDGITWRFIKTPSVVRSLTIDSAGCIFVGSNGDFGYLHSDSLGTYQYLS